MYMLYYGIPVLVPISDSDIRTIFQSFSVALLAWWFPVSTTLDDTSWWRESLYKRRSIQPKFADRDGSDGLCASLEIFNSTIFSDSV